MRADKSWPVVVAEDDPDDYHLLQFAWQRSAADHPLVWVEDGAALLGYLRQASHRTALVLLDVKMPRKGGHEALQELKSDPLLRRIPAVMLSTSLREPDIRLAYDLGAASYFVKPDGLEQMTALVRLIRSYWLESVQLADGGA